MSHEQIPLSRRDFLGGASACALAGCATAPKREQPCVRFGYITDVHFAAHLKPSMLRQYPEGVRRVTAFAHHMNALKPDFVVEGGDFKDLGRTPQESLDYLDAVEGALAQFAGRRYHVLGNHDHDNIAKETFLRHIENADQTRARAYYAFTCGGIRFIVLDACYRPDGQPYDRGNFNWREAFVPPAQIDFLRRELQAAAGPCVLMLHHQLDAEDDTCVRNAAEIRAILKASGKVRSVIQGHYHEGSFREIDGIGYFTARASVCGTGYDANAYSLIEVYADGRIGVRGFNAGWTLEPSAEGEGWRDPLGWRPGHYQVHYIFTGRSEAMLHIFPDGTSMLLDCGDTMRFYGTPAETPHLPDISRRAAEWVARYVARVNPKGAFVDYFHLSHYHEDHAGGKRYHGARIKAPTGDYWCCGAAEAARFLQFDTVVDRAYPTFDDPVDVLDAPNGRGDGTAENVRALYRDLASRGGTRIERFKLGSDRQFVQRDPKRARPGFRVFNVCANGRYVNKAGEMVDLYRHLVEIGARQFNENGMSCGLLVSYGAFRYYTAGDFSDNRVGLDGKRHQIEDVFAEALDPVDVAKCNHHGHHAMFPELVKALKARVWTCCVLDQQHMTDDTMRRLSDRALYPDARTILPTYMPHDRPPDGKGPVSLKDVPRVVYDEPCHVVLDVPEGGQTYTMTCLSARDESARVKAVFGFFSRGATV